MRLLWIFLPIFCALAACGPSSPSSSTQQTAKNVLVTKALSKDVPVQLYEFGRIASPETVDVKPQVSGRITEVHFTEGQDVKKGDLLFVIDPRPFQADLEQAQAQLQSDSAQLDLNQNNLQRDEKIGPQHFVSEQQIDTDKANVKNFQGAVGRDQASIDRAKLNLEYCYVRSPIDGRTGRRLVDAGNYVATGAVSLVNIQRQDPVYADFHISENDLARLRENMPGNQLNVDVVTPTQPDVTKSGALTFLDNAVSAQAGTVLLRATIPNSDHYLWPGQYVKVALTLQTLKGTVVVPSQTIQMGAKGTYLFVVTADNTVEQRLVSQGVRYRDFVVVAEGLKADETVVVEGQLTIGNGAKVNPAPYRGGIPGGSPSASGLTQRQHSGDSSGNVDPPASPKPAL
ncbi:MAG TPA: efflux RND transporter periplasmic adaptor subunit [Chthoniobacterales bacterium]|nr:efflux RND transporter periplasmic adaptor subunit [Chthoniobacterales bacterium]